MRVDDPSRSPTLTDDQEPSYARRFPPETARYQRGEAHLAIEHHQGRLEIAKDRLHLDHEENVLAGMPGQYVDRAALTADLEAHFGFGDPSSTEQASDTVVDQRRVRAIEEPIDRLASPVDPDNHTRLERTPDALDHIEPELAGTTTLEERHCPPRDAGPRRQVDLAPLAPVMQDPDGSSEADGIHDTRGRPGLLTPPLFDLGFPAKAAGRLTSAGRAPRRRPRRSDPRRARTSPARRRWARPDAPPPCPRRLRRLSRVGSRRSPG